MIQKTNECNLSFPRAYRHINLLLALGKSSEYLLTKRMAWIAIRHKIITSQQYDTVHGRSKV